MKFFQYKASLAAVAASLALVACGNVSKVNSDGTTDEPVWPNVERVNHHNDMGTFPNLESLKEVKAGMTKDQCIIYLVVRTLVKVSSLYVSGITYSISIHRVRVLTM